MSSILNVALGGIQRGVKGFLTTANNVANFNTDGYRSRKYDPDSDTVTLRDPSFDPDAVRGQLGVDDFPINDVDLARELVHTRIDEHAIKANVTVAKAANRTLGELFDILG
jgi:hypothetical protein